MGNIKPNYIRISIDMVNDVKFKKIFLMYKEKSFAIYWMWLTILSHAFKQSGYFKQSDDMGHDDITLQLTFDSVHSVYGLEFIKEVMNLFTDDEFKMLSVDDNGIYYVINWSSYQADFTGSNERVVKHREKSKLNEETEAIVDEVLNAFNRITGKRILIKTESYREMVRGRLSEGFTLDDFKSVIVWKYNQWSKDPKMQLFVRPSTLFRPSHFDTYLNERPRNAPKVMTDADVRAQQPVTPDEASPVPAVDPNALFAVKDMFGRRSYINQAQFDRAEDGYFTKVED